MVLLLIISLPEDNRLGLLVGIESSIIELLIRAAAERVLQHCKGIIRYSHYPRDVFGCDLKRFSAKNCGGFAELLIRNPIMQTAR